MVFADTARQTGHKSPTDGHSPEQIPCDIPSEAGATHEFNQHPGLCLGRYSAYETSPGISAIQASPAALTSSTVPPPIRSPHSKEDDLPHPHTRIYARNCTLSSTKPSPAPSPSKLSDSERRNGPLHERKSLATLLQIQQEICDCSEGIIRPSRSLLDHSHALGSLLCATDRFVSHVTQMCGESIPGSSSTSVSGVQSTTTASNNTSSSNKHAFFIDPSIYSPDRKEENLGSCRHYASPGPTANAAVFHILMACHAHILTAYDTIISSTVASSTTPSHSPSPPTTSSTTTTTTTTTGGESCFSIGKFSVRPHTSLESLLHLQVISHQLDHLNSAIYRYLMSSADTTLSSASASLLSLSSRLGPPSKSSSSSSSLNLGEQQRASGSLQEFAIQAVEWQGMVLKGKILARMTEV